MLDLRMGLVAKRLAGTTVRMLGYNGSVPGPTITVRQGEQLTVRAANDADLDTTVHWHGLYFLNDVTRRAVRHAAADRALGELHLPARVPGPRPVLVPPGTSVRTTPRRWASTATSWCCRPTPTTGRRHTAAVLTLDDVLIEDGVIATFSRSEITHAAMGRFGDVILVGGETDPRRSSAWRGGAALADQHRQRPRLPRSTCPRG